MAIAVYDLTGNPVKVAEVPDEQAAADFAQKTGLMYSGIWGMFDYETQQWIQPVNVPFGLKTDVEERYFADAELVSV